MQIHQVSQFDDSSTVSTTYLGKTDRTRKDVIKVQEQFSVTNHSTIEGTLLDGTDCKILLDIGASKIFMSKQYYLRNKWIAKVHFRGKVIQVRNGESVNIWFIFPIIVIIQGCMFEIYTMVSETHDNVD